ncbi:hypothetical protein ACOQFO_00240 [Ureibacillus sp. MALMAid1270]|uniref:hypothetical protein n=1 Tax=Ureibacillus sp. MALMAid1270 TaxID=3411629 RepID=UPI003BA7DEB8
MSDQLKKEMEKIEIPKNLNDSVLKGVQRAKLENLQEEKKYSKRQFKPYIITLLAVAVIAILLLPAIQSLDFGLEEGISQGTNENETQIITNGDSNLTEDMHQLISDYIIWHYQHNQDQQTDVQFEVHKVYGTSQEGDTIKVYMWSYYNSFNRATGNEEVRGASLPVTLTLEKIGGDYKVTEIREAQDGSQYVDSIKTMFPEQYVEEALQQPNNMSGLIEEMQEKVNAWLNEEEESNEDRTTDESTLFDLKSEEGKGYGEFQQDLNPMHLYGLDPVSIAKLYVLAGYEKKYDVQYALYTNREEYIMWSAEDDQKIPEKDRGSVEIFKNIDKGTFIQTSDYTGYIEFYVGEELLGFQMIKNEDGIWQVAFMPLQ